MLLTKAKLPENWRTNGAQPLRDAFEDAGYQTELTLCDGPEAICKAIHHDCKPGDIVAVGGGDGTINAILDTVLDCKVVLIPIPLGTANDFARSLNMPDGPVDAARAAIHGQISMLDIGQVNDQTFVNAASIGVPADARKRINPDLKRTLGAISYAVANWQSWHEMDPMDLTVTCGDEDPQQLKLRQVTVTNGRYFGGGLRPSDKKRPDDGVLHMFAIRDNVDTLSGMDIAAELLFGSVDDSEYALTMQCDEILIEGADGAPILADGEIISELPARFSIRAGTLPVFAPKAFFDQEDQPPIGHPDNALPQREVINDIMLDTLDLMIRLQAIYPMAHKSDLKALCHDSLQELRAAYRQLELSLRPHGLPTSSPDPDLHSLEDLRDKVISWLLESADMRLANGLRMRSTAIADQLSTLSTNRLPDDIKADIEQLDQKITAFRTDLDKVIPPQG